MCFLVPEEKETIWAIKIMEEEVEHLLFRRFVLLCSERAQLECHEDRLFEITIELGLLAYR